MVDKWFVENLVCPIDQQPLGLSSRTLVCPAGHAYPIVDGVPVMLVPGAARTIDVMNSSLDRVGSKGIDQRAPDLYLESLGINEEEKRGVIGLATIGSKIDPVVAYLVAATNGL